MTDAASSQCIRFDGIDALVERLTAEIERALVEGVDERGSASLVLSGGTTPAPLLERLSHSCVPWSHVSVTLTDERCVPADDPRSNEAMVRRILMRGSAANARFVGLHAEGPGAVEQPTLAAERVAGVQQPFDFVVLGMGDDGHFASLFPGSETLAPGLDLDNTQLAVVTEGKGTQRVSLTLAALVHARHIKVFITGEPKWSVLTRAREDIDPHQLPVRALLAQGRTPVDVYWAPSPEAS